MLEPTRGVSRQAGIDSRLQKNDLRVKPKQQQPDTTMRRVSVWDDNDQQVEISGIVVR